MRERTIEAQTAFGCGLSLELLKAVSRSFYLSMVWLPAPMRRGVALGYLLARATDSVADSSSAPSELRESVLEAMGRCIAAPAAPPEESELLQRLREVMAAAQQKPSEAELLRRFGDALRALRALPEGEAALLREVLASIIEGQLWDLRYFRCRQVVEQDDDTRRYTQLVAGCVGIFWTRLGRETLGENFCPTERAELMEQAASRYGRGLQLINILRDRCEDAARGRSYLCSDPQIWLNRAERYMRDGLDYSRRLGLMRLRFASMLPALIGLRTLRLLRRNRDETKRVRIPRRSVWAVLAQALCLSLRRRRTRFP